MGLEYLVVSDKENSMINILRVLIEMQEQGCAQKGIAQ
jgi:hypothetical protein